MYYININNNHNNKFAYIMFWILTVSMNLIVMIIDSDE